nr:aldo/keto reductase [Staphylococcus aureus]
MNHIEISKDVKIPVLGFGVFQIPQEQTAEAVIEAIKAGYRHIDTAQSYLNETEVGQGIEASGIVEVSYLLRLKYGLKMLTMKIRSNQSNDHYND